MLKILRGILIFFVVVVLLLVVGVWALYANLVSTVNLADYDSFEDVPLYTWARLDLSDETMCSDASDYFAYVRRGESDNLILHFSGGGVAWNAETAAVPITPTNFSGFYFASIWEIIHALLTGFLQTDNEANPFSDWTVVYVPYCTADFHIGAATLPYTVEDGTEKTLYFNGRQNVTEILDWVFATFPQPEKLIVSGESAGAFGSLFWLPTIAEKYPESQIYHIADGNYLETELWPETVDTVWQADTANLLGFVAENDLTGGVYLQYSENSAPNVTYLQINTAYDSVLIYFNSVLSGVEYDAAYRETWSEGLRASMRRVEDSNLNYFYYITDYGLDAETQTTPHTSISMPLFYEIEEDGTLLVDWLRRIIIDGEGFSVGAEFLP